MVRHLKRLVRLLRLYRRSRRDERPVLVWVVGLLLAVEASLRVSGYERTRERVARLGRGTVREAPLSVADLSRLVFRASRVTHVEAPCLRRSLVLWWLLRRYGVASEIHMGFAHDTGGLTGHAWVEVDGVLVMDAPGTRTRYVPLRDAPELASGGAWPAG